MAPLRVFTLGMGSGAFTELCERLATAGNGSHMMTVEGEPLAFKAKRLVNAMETPQVMEMSIDWGGLSQGMNIMHPDMLIGIYQRSSTSTTSNSSSLTRDENPCHSYCSRWTGSDRGHHKVASCRRNHSRLSGSSSTALGSYSR